jgi:hypothetical protein
VCAYGKKQLFFGCTYTTKDINSCISVFWYGNTVATWGQGGAPAGLLGPFLQGRLLFLV